MAAIRVADASDAASVHDLVVALSRHLNAESQVRLTPAQLAADMAAERCWCFLAFGTSPSSERPSSERPIGFALGYGSYSTWEGHGLYLEDLYVEPSARGLGVGKELLLAVVQKARREGCRRLQWQALSNNISAMRWYTSDSVGASERVEAGGVRWVNFIMRTAGMEAFAAKREGVAHASGLGAVR
jgi:GNAT superfamily N-acetyltransferase